MGITRLVLSRELNFEPVRSLTPTPSNLHKTRSSQRGIFAVLLDNIRSAWNVGSIFRSADGFGFTHAYLCGISPTPDGPAGEAVQKTSLGAEDSVPWSYHKDALRLVRGLKREGWQIIGLEEDPRGIPIDQVRTTVGKRGIESVLIVGNEVTGIDPGLLDLCDEIATIPMRGAKKSLNAAIAFGVAAYALAATR
jgi:tRNA G18 (ribose-2'-O)-methylase SpoU